MPKEAIIRKKVIAILTQAKWVCWYPPKVKFQQSDVFGIIDVLALRGREKKNIQITTLSNIPARRKKILTFFKTTNVELPVEIWGWNKKTKNFKKETVKAKSIRKA